ncbi:MAG: MopE-related protein [Myxococcota bacterium]
MLITLLATIGFGAPTTTAFDEAADSADADDTGCVSWASWETRSAQITVPVEVTDTQTLLQITGMDTESRGWINRCGGADIDDVTVEFDGTVLSTTNINVQTTRPFGTTSSAFRLNEPWAPADSRRYILSQGTYDLVFTLNGRVRDDGDYLRLEVSGDVLQGRDWDGDGFVSKQLTGGTDCDDDDAAINTAATEIWYDGIDQDCSGGSDFDQDGDGEDSAADLVGGTDCDDTDPAVNTTATEVWYDAIDQDCSGGSDFDQDGDGQDRLGDGGGTDCDDLDPTIFDGAEEIWYDGIDSNCDGESDYDQDGDDYDSEAELPGVGDDCDDLDPDIHPDAPDEWYDGIDSDCRGNSDYDADEDGEDSAALVPETGTDCDDNDNTVGKEKPEIWYNGIDNDCSGNASDYDQDGDGQDSYADTVPPGPDCDDLDPDVDGDSPGYSDTCEREVLSDGSRVYTPRPDGTSDSGCSCNSQSYPGGFAVVGLGLLLAGLRRRRR